MDRLTELGRDIAAERCDGLAALFMAAGAPAPRLLWAPTPDRLPTAPLAALLRYWQGLHDGAALPRTTAIDPTEMRFILGHVMLVDVWDGGEDFVYRLYGSRIAASCGRDMTGRRTSDFPDRLGLFFGATYHAVLLRREPLYTEHRPKDPDGPVGLWQRLILPLAAADGSIVRFLVGNVPAGADDCGPMMPNDAERVEPGG